ncbi:MAG TPA: hypothetical protein VNW71_25735 [Thermoanaerobaculia bacterium]|nr:hypothetical protein [Thermoanaerobaculia bacterium]
MIFAGALLFGGVAAAAPPGSYRIEEIAVAGGNPVAGQAGGVLYKGSLADCGKPPSVEIKPVSTFLSSSTKLRVRIAACQAGLPKPRAECRLGPSERTSFEDWTQDLALRLPDRTGVHSLALACSAGGQDLGTFTAEMYLGFEVARPMLAAPPAEWHKLAASWGAGFKRRDGEAPVLQRILGHTYGYGQQQWRYGFCKRHKDGDCVFGTTKIPQDIPLVCGQPGFCRCDWFQILPGGPAGCNFSTCFGFSDVFEFLSALMGIGGLQDLVVEGKHKNGFVLHPWARSIDAALEGFVHCGYRDLRCIYVFLNHDLRRRDGLIYDATFGRIYTSLDDLIAQNVVSWDGNNAELDSGAACFRSVGYGQWFFWGLEEELGACKPPRGRDRELAPEPSGPPDPAIGVRDKAATFVHRSVKARIIRDTHEVAVTANVSRTVAGTYSVDARLARGGETIAYGNIILHLDQEGDEPVSFRFPLKELPGKHDGLTLTVVLYSMQPPRHLDDAQIDLTALLKPRP